jgi:ribonuclease HII
LCGIDEAGRGPIAGPLVVAGVILKKPIAKLADSKILSEKKREALFDEITNNALYHIVFTHNDIIDEKGLSTCLKKSILEIMQTLQTTQYLMDGNTAFGISNLNFKIKADATVEEVSAASILAKVSRDRFMQEAALQYPLYGFEKHKGYGTAKHIEAIKTHGFCQLHRISFKTKALQEHFQKQQVTLF